MSVLIHPQQFQRGIKPLDPTNQAQMDLALRLALSVMLPPNIDARRGADQKDCELAVEAIERVTSLYIDFVSDVVNRVSENLPVTDQKVDLKQFVELIQDCKNDAVGLLQIAGEQQSGR